MRNVLMVMAIAFAIQVTSSQSAFKHKHNMANLEPEEIANLKTKKMTLALDLNEAQQQKVYDINVEHANARKAHMQKRKAEKADGNVTKPTKEEHLAMMNKVLDDRIATKAKMKAILNKEQYIKWEKMAAKHHAKMKDKAHAHRKA